MLSRRGFVKVSAASVASLALRPLGLLPALAQSSSSDYRALVCIFLFGGNDSNNMVIPVDDANLKAYTSIRGSLALTQAEMTPTVYAKTGNAPYAFHSDLPELASMFANGDLAVVANVGSLVQPTTRSQYQAQQALPLNLFSHSDQQLQWQTSVPSGRSSTGWAGRAADLVTSQNSSNFPTFLSVAGNSIMGTGSNTQPVALNPGQSLDMTGFSGTPASNARLSALQNLLTLETGLQLVQASNAILSDSLAEAKALDAALAKATPLKTAFPKTSLGAQLQQVATIIQVRDALGMNRQIFFASLGGFDTHTLELETHKTLYPQLSQAAAAFSNALIELGVENNVTTFTESDFSRTFQPTTGDGSDHAWGSHHLVLGGAVKGGDIYGAFPHFSLGGPDDTDTRGRWIPTLAVDQYGATLCQWFGIQASDLPKVFPNLGNFSSQNLGFLG
jgi:uncharacterized protein (DUF1501 family)